tara:strand:+ start:11997 stop:13034 length:1038 start_codon:yes stop_codon:yes gene_type:complete
VTVPGVLFRVDVGPTIGLGHINRCVALAEAIRLRGLQGVFLLAPSCGGANGVSQRGFPVETLNECVTGTRKDSAVVIAAAERHGYSTVVVDSYAARAEYLSRLRSAGLQVVAVDDEARDPTPAHILINGGAHAGGLAYRSLSGDTQLLLGPDYALLRSEFWSCPPRAIAGSVRRVLVTVGGDDRQNLTVRLIEWLVGRLEAGTALDVVIGPFFGGADAVERVAAGSPLNIRLISAPEHLRDLMMESDLAVCAGGQTTYELAVTGTPAVAMDVFENQAHGVQALARSGALIYGGRPTNDRLPEELGPAIREAVECSARRQRLSSAGRALVDGQGALRAAAEIARAA